MKVPENKVEKRSHLNRFSKENVLQTIYEELPEEQKERFVQYRSDWNLADTERPDLPFPLCISLELVAACNLHCTHCVRNRPFWRQRFPHLFQGTRMGFETFQRIVDECANEGLPSLWLGCSGEALLEKDLYEMLEYAHNKGIMDLILTTNGTLLDNQFIDRMVDLPLTRLNISLDAFTDETYRLVRGGDFTRVRSAIDYLIKRKESVGSRLPVLRLTFIDMPINRHEKEMFIDHWQNQADVVDIQKYIDFDVVKKVDHADSRAFSCSCPWRIVDIMANGDLVPCNSFYALPDLIMGNIHEAGIKQIWNSERFKQFRNDMKKKSFTDACLTCFSAQESV